MKRSALIVTAAPLLAIALLVGQIRPAVGSAPRIAGLVLLVAGIALVTLARIQLGDAFSISPRATRLVTHGLYSRVRNPVYLFSGVAFAGFIVYLGWPRLFLLFLILIPVQFLRARAEARVLEERFGEQYRRYKSTTWF